MIQEFGGLNIQVIKKEIEEDLAEYLDSDDDIDDRTTFNPYSMYCVDEEEDSSETLSVNEECSIDMMRQFKPRRTRLRKS